MNNCRCRKRTLDNGQHNNVVNDDYEFRRTVHQGQSTGVVVGFSVKIAMNVTRLSPNENGRRVSGTIGHVNKTDGKILKQKPEENTSDENEKKTTLRNRPVSMTTLLG